MQYQEQKVLRIRVDNRKWMKVAYETEKERELLLSISRDMDALRKRDRVYNSKRESIEAREELTHQGLASTDLVVESINHDELKEYLKKAVYSLTPRERKIIYLHFEEDISFQQIAKKMSLPLSTVYNIYKLALTKLKKSVQNFI